MLYCAECNRVNCKEERGREGESLNPVVFYCAECSRVKCKGEREREKREGGRERALTQLYCTVLNAVGLNVKKRERESEP